MPVSRECVDLVKGFESFRANAYLDEYADPPVWTIGYGKTEGVKPGHCCTEPEAAEYVEAELNRRAAEIEKHSAVRLTQNQLDALASFAYNVKGGVYRLFKSNLWRKVQAGNFIDAGPEFERWVYAGQTKLPGLVKRRKAERALFERVESSREAA